MAEKIVSPGVFTNEKDLSFLPTGVASIGAVVLGPTTKGPAFVPTVVTSFEDFKAKFGDLDETTYIPYTVKSYLRNASNVIVVRVMQEGGYSTGVLHISYDTTLVGVIHPSAKNLGSNTYDLSASTLASSGTATGKFGITLSGSGVTAQAVTASGAATSSIAFDRVFGTSVKSDKKGFMYLWFKDFASLNQDTATLAPTVGNAALDLSGTTYGAAQKAATPYITTQRLSGQNPQKLFRFISQGHGADTNTAYKISIINTLMPGDDPATSYGSFTVLVREHGDTDQRPVVLETFVGCNLDPDSTNYIARNIGDRYAQVNSDNNITYKGNYANRSKYVYVEVADAVAKKGVPPTYKPYGLSL